MEILTAHIWESIPGTQVSFVPWTELAGRSGTDLHGEAVLAVTGNFSCTQLARDGCQSMAELCVAPSQHSEGTRRTYALPLPTQKTLETRGFTSILRSHIWGTKSFDPSTCSLKHYLCPTNRGKGLGPLKLLRLALDSVLLGVGIPKITQIVTVKTNIPITSDSVSNDQTSHLKIIIIRCVLKLHGSVRRTNLRYLIRKECLWNDSLRLQYGHHMPAGDFKGLWGGLPDHVMSSFIKSQSPLTIVISLASWLIQTLAWLHRKVSFWNEIQLFNTSPQFRAL